MTQANLTQVKETELFFRQWLRSPRSMGSIIPSSRALAPGGGRPGRLAAGSGGGRARRRHRRDLAGA